MNKEEQQRKKDIHFLKWAKRAANASTCLKKHLGVVLITKRGEFFSGTNGAPRALYACRECFKTGDGIEHGHECYAVHAERQAILKAAKAGASTKGSTLYSYMGIPCKDCLLELIEAGVSRIVCIKGTYYDKLSMMITNGTRNKNCRLKIDVVETEDSTKEFHKAVN